MKLFVQRSGLVAGAAAWMLACMGAGGSLAEPAAQGAAAAGAAAQLAQAGCPGLRSGRYRVVDPNVDDAGGTVLQVDAEALRATVPGGKGPLPLTDTGACSFSFPDAQGRSRMLLSSSGLGLLLRHRAGSAAKPHADISMLVPEQALPLSELAGTWNRLSYAREGRSAPLLAALHSFSVGSDGAVSITRECKGLVCAAPATAAPRRLASHADGGFTLGGGAGEPARVFAFKTAGGQVLMVERLPGHRGLAVAARQQALALPKVGAGSRFWELFVNAQGVSSEIESPEITVTATDPAAGTVTRRRTADGRLDTQVYNLPLPGMRYRTADTCSVNGAPSPCDGSLSMTLPGAGMTVYVGLEPKPFLAVAIAQP